MIRGRAVRGGVAFAVGFAGALLAVVASDLVDERAGTRVVGSIDFFEYCRSAVAPDARALVTADDANSWRCAVRPNGLFDIKPVDVDAACRLQYGELATARVLDASDPYSWRCVVPE